MISADVFTVQIDADKLIEGVRPYLIQILETYSDK